MLTDGGGWQEARPGVSTWAAGPSLCKAKVQTGHQGESDRSCPPQPVSLQGSMMPGPGRQARGEESHMAAWSKPRAQSAAAADGLILPKFLYLYCVKMYPEFCVLALCSGFATC